MENWFSIKKIKQWKVSSTKGGETTLCPNWGSMPQILIYTIFSLSVNNQNKYICRKGQSVVTTGKTLMWL